MVVNFDRYFIHADYKKPYSDSNSEKFIALSCGCMAESITDLLALAKEWAKDKKLKNIRLFVIPKNTLEHYNITKD